MSPAPDVSVVIPTFNREDLLCSAIRSVLSQDPGPIQFEVLVVDNNSTDGTRRAVQSIAKEAPGCVRYLFEPRQGVSYARNLGIAAARAPVLAFLDDDVRAAPGWIRQIKEGFDANREVGFLGGKVKSQCLASPPGWLTQDHWAPLALLDYGDSRIPLVSASGVGVISANCAVRKTVFDSAGVFDPGLQRIGATIGSMEDHELFERFLSRGVRGLYLPSIVAFAEIPPVRLTKAYHRAWHYQHGRFYAIHRSSQLEHSNRGRLFGAPAHLYRQAAVDGCRYVKHLLKGGPDRAFSDEVKLRFFAGFVSRRFRDTYPTLASFLYPRPKQ